MPRIDAPTVREHRENVRRKLIDAAEEIARRDGVGALSAGAVTKAAGIARNSIYRYVDSVDDLRGLVLARYMPAWMGAVQAALDAASTPEQRIFAWVRANLAQAAEHGHGWLMEVGHPRAIGADGVRTVEGAHRDAADVLILQWRALLEPATGSVSPSATTSTTISVTPSTTVPVSTPATPAASSTPAPLATPTPPAEALAELTRALVEGGFRCLDQGGDLAAVTAAIEVAVGALIDAHKHGAARNVSTSE